MIDQRAKCARLSRLHSPPPLRGSYRRPPLVRDRGPAAIMVTVSGKTNRTQQFFFTHMRTPEPVAVDTRDTGRSLRIGQSYPRSKATDRVLIGPQLCEPFPAVKCGGVPYTVPDCIRQEPHGVKQGTLAGIIASDQCGQRLQRNGRDQSGAVRSGSLLSSNTSSPMTPTQVSRNISKLRTTNAQKHRLHLLARKSGSFNITRLTHRRYRSGRDTG